MSTSKKSPSRIFVHEPISRPRTIRLFNLFAAQDPKSRLCGSFTLHQLNPSKQKLKSHAPAFKMSNVLDHQQLPYIALSYSWQESDSPTTQELVPSDDECSVLLPDSRLIHITSNLRSFLLRIRTASFDQRLWIDQLCIRQDAGDTARPSDKEQQIPLMRDIYAQSAGAILWVGEASSDAENKTTRAVFKLALAISRFVKTDTAKKLSQSNVVPSDDEMIANSLLPLSDPMWLRLFDFVELRVFSRLWVLQEAVMAPHVLVTRGGLGIKLPILGEAVMAVNKMRWSVEIGFLRDLEQKAALQPPDMLTLREAHTKLLLASAGSFGLTTMYLQRYFHSKGQGWTMEDLLLTTRMFRANREFRHDRVYALLGLAKDAKQPEDGSALPDALVPDYTKTAEQVYREVTEYCLSQGSLAILESLEGPFLRAEDSSLPSWVPDFSVPAPRVGQTQTFVPHGINAGGSGIRVSGDTLLLDGYRVDTIREVQEFDVIDLSTTSTRLEKAARLIDEPLAPYAAGVGLSRLEAFWRTLTADTHRYVETPAPETLVHDFAAQVIESCVRSHLDDICDDLMTEGIAMPVQDTHPLAALANPQVWNMFIERMSVQDAADRRPPILYTDSKIGGPLPLPLGSLGKSFPGLKRIFWEGLVPLLGERFWEKQKGSADLFQLDHIYATSKQLFFVTKGGLFGLAPFGTRSGDDVFVFRVEGAPPMLLRKAETESGKGDHTIVGGCYLHGLSAVDALAGDLGDVPWAEVRIR